MYNRRSIVFHRGYNILREKDGSFRLLPKNVITIAGLKAAEKTYGYGYMNFAHPAFNNLDDCISYIDENFPVDKENKGD